MHFVYILCLLGRDAGSTVLGRKLWDGGKSAAFFDVAANF
jgi:hypothetical protein